MASSDEYAVRLQDIESLYLEVKRLSDALGLLVERPRLPHIELSSSELHTLLDATKNIGLIINAIVEDLPEESSGMRDRIGF